MNLKQSGNIVLKNAHYGIQWNGVSNSISIMIMKSLLIIQLKTIDLNQWYLLLVHTGTKISLYIDGAFDSEYFNNYSPNQGSAVVYDLYFRYEVQWGYFIGDIDDVALWNRALSAQEIQQLYTGSTNNSYSWSPSGETTSSINVLPNTFNYTVDVTSGTTTCQSDVTFLG